MKFTNSFRHYPGRKQGDEPPTVPPPFAIFWLSQAGVLPVWKADVQTPPLSPIFNFELIHFPCPQFYIFNFELILMLPQPYLS
jgi:hypothetical protein